MLRRVPAVLLLLVTAWAALPAPARADSSSDYKRRLEDREEKIRSRINRLHDDNRLSRDHRNRGIERLERVRDDAHSGKKLSRSRYESDQTWMDETERTVNQWSNGAYRNRWGYSR